MAVVQNRPKRFYIWGGGFMLVLKHRHLSNYAGGQYE